MKNFLPMKNAYSARSLFVAAVLFCLSALSATAQTVTQDHIKYAITNSTQTAAVTGTDGSYINSVVIADSVKNSNGQYFPVVAINSDAFKDNRYITSVVLGSNLKKIGSSAFSGCERLTRINVPEGVEAIENYAFQNGGVRYADLPSTLRTFGNGVFTSNTADLDTLVLRTAYTDADGRMKVLPFSKSSFKGPNRYTCILMVPKKAYEQYCFRTVDNLPDGALNWGSFFTHIVAFGTAPSGLDVLPANPVRDYRDLATVALTFRFDDEGLADVLSFGEGDALKAALVVKQSSTSNGPAEVVLEADPKAVKFSANTFTLSFADVLEKHRDLFVATTDEAKTIDVRLRVEGQAQLEGCPFGLTSYFAAHPVAWEVPLLPAVNDLPIVPDVRPTANAENDGLYKVADLKELTVAFPGFSALSLDAATGAYLKARLYADGELLSETSRAKVTGDNTLTLNFNFDAEQLYVRRTSGVEAYDFTVKLEGQVNLFDGDLAKNYRFTLPSPDATTAAAPHWAVRPVFFPEPTGVSFEPANAVVALDKLADVAVRFEGVSKVALDAAAESSTFSAQLLMDGCAMAFIGADRMRAEGNVLHLLFDRVDPRFITTIGDDKDRLYDFSVHLTADLLTDGYPCRIVVGAPTPTTDASTTTDAASSESTTGANSTTPAAPYVQQWPVPHWDVRAIVWPVPTLTVTTPQATGNGPFDYDRLRVVEISIDNYESVKQMPVDGTADGSAAVVARLLRGGRTVSMVNSVKIDGSKIVVDFGEALTYHAAGITPDEDPSAPVVLVFEFTGDLLFDGVPYRLVVEGDKIGARWEVNPIVVRKLPEPQVNCEDGRISFSSATSGVTYHYSIENVDSLGTNKTVGTKNANGGSTLTLPLTREYVIRVYSTRANYEDSEPTVVKLRLKGEPTLVEK